MFKKLLGIKVYENCTKDEEMTEEEEAETLFYLNMELEEKINEMDNKKNK